MTGQHDADASSFDVFVPLNEAADAYGTSVATLRQRARSGTLRAYKVAGPHGREWRVSLRSLEAAGFTPRLPAQATGHDSPRVLELEASLAAVRRRLVAEQRRADRADQELGYALLELGRLRSSSRPVDHS